MLKERQCVQHFVCGQRDGKKCTCVSQLRVGIIAYAVLNGFSVLFAHQITTRQTHTHTLEKRGFRLATGEVLTVRYAGFRSHPTSIS